MPTAQELWNFQHQAGQGFRGDNTNDLANNADENTADIPVLGWLTGATARRDAARNRGTQQRAQNAWTDLMGVAPSADDLAVDYGQLGQSDEYGDLLGGPSSVDANGRGLSDEQAAMRSLQGITSAGGYTAADRAQSNAFHDSNAQQMGAANQAAMQQAGARGQLGGGQQLAAQLAGSQGLAMANQQGDASIQQAAMQRQMQALGMQGSLGGQMNQEQLARQNALDQYNQQQLGYRRQRQAANVGLQAQTNQSRSNANQQSYENMEHGVAGLTNQYQQGQNNRNASGARQDQSGQALTSTIGGILAAL
jgi:hypothetical protein